METIIDLRRGEIGVRPDDDKISTERFARKMRKENQANIGQFEPFCLMLKNGLHAQCSLQYLQDHKILDKTNSHNQSCLFSFAPSS
jgi:hypothetical protein